MKRFFGNNALIMQDIISTDFPVCPSLGRAGLCFVDRDQVSIHSLDQDFSSSAYVVGVAALRF
jgi:hypothetical protein